MYVHPSPPATLLPIVDTTRGHSLTRALLVSDSEYLTPSMRQPYLGSHFTTPFPPVTYYYLLPAPMPNFHVSASIPPLDSTLHPYCDLPPRRPSRLRTLQISETTLPTVLQLPEISLCRLSPTSFSPLPSPPVIYVKTCVFRWKLIKINSFLSARSFFRVLPNELIFSYLIQIYYICLNIFKYK